MYTLKTLNTIQEVITLFCESNRIWSDYSYFLSTNVSEIASNVLLTLYAYTRCIALRYNCSRNNNNYTEFGLTFL